ncbi:VOC family protein [Sneathiella limimaris]|uniref:VOC family protein n=1 Tax=Sneathiella limimaris TaxID=1964213 RepID=UPI00146BB4BA|nr:VOC family protein [Sneathiella limimaris]
MLHKIEGLDHTLVGVADLEQARVQYERLGFTITPRGSHIGWGTANYCIMFDEDYIELLGIVAPSKESNGLDAQLEDRGEGMLGLAFASSDPEETVRSMKLAGLEPTGPHDLKRKLELPEGDVIPEFKLIRFPTQGLSKRGLFICHHLTPEMIREPEWLEHANGSQYIQSVVVLVEDPASLIPHYTQLCGSLNVTTTDATITVSVGRLNLIFVKEQDLDLLFPGLFISDELPELPHILSMSIAVESLSDTADYLKKKDVAVQDISSGRALRIQPKDACGVLLEFVEA